MAKTPERTEFLTDVLITAVEGGINYWATVHAYRPNAEVPFVVVSEAEDEAEDESDIPPAQYRITIRDIATALGKFTSGQKGCVIAESAGPGEFKRANRTNGEEGDYDAGDADCILQIAAFGGIVYG